MRITSKKEGTEPVVMAFILGIVIVGGLALAVNGKALPDRIRLTSIKIELRSMNLGLPLYKAHSGLGRVDEIAGKTCKKHDTVGQRVFYLRKASTTMKMTLSNGAGVISVSPEKAA